MDGLGFKRFRSVVGRADQVDESFERTPSRDKIIQILDLESIEERRERFIR